MKIVITGTHFTPAQAVIEELKKDPNIKITYIGRSKTMEGDNSFSVESKVLPQLNVRFIPLIAGRFKREFSIWTVVSLLKVPIGFFQSFYFLLREKPDVVVSFGGYVGLPVVLNSWLLSIPVILHEQTLISGLANRFSGWFADRIAVSFDVPYSFDKKKVILTGNPIRPELLNINTGNENSFKDKFSKDILDLIDNSKREKLPIILVTGGNQGSHFINHNIELTLSELLENSYVIHQTGDSKFRDYERLKKKDNKRYLVEKWFDVYDWALILMNSDLVISRAGANTLTELAYFSIPTLTIPLPNIMNNEQLKNAHHFKKLGLCQIISQNELTPKRILAEVKNSLRQISKLSSNAQNAKGEVKTGAAKSIALEIKLIASKNG